MTHFIDIGTVSCAATTRRFLLGYRSHMDTLNSFPHCRDALPQDQLNMAVVRLRTPLNWSELADIIDNTITSVSASINDLPDCERRAANQLCILRAMLHNTQVGLRTLQAELASSGT